MLSTNFKSCSNILSHKLKFCTHKFFMSKSSYFPRFFAKRSIPGSSVVQSHRKTYIPLHSIFIFFGFSGPSMSGSHPSLPSTLHTFVMQLSHLCQRSEGGCVSDVSDFAYVQEIVTA